MKTTFKTLALIALLGFTTACSDEDDDDAVKIQAHDQNQMMTVMHEMMAEMQTMKMTQDPDIDYAEMMKMHHMGAIEMAELELRSGNNSEMKAMAQAIVDAQKKEITQLDSFLASSTPTTMNMEFHMQMMEGMERMGKQADLQIINGKIDQDFATLMIGHHQSATEMAQMQLLMGKNTQLKSLSSMIIEEQNKEITQFQTWLLANRSK
ncbi:DUF305 domain-containing protein [Dyadobacter psychrotolerans]|jgi:uncharacterized protein (DUF305 family)|uniref:DUF305 domain-containing protein n=1 Tax=Dyadobacter psychrotolerans TaxID=2541721 RepID=A0A4R5D8M9_9BACT|nr:DUF305 domain-containing protein [Dyadobacter psychrotolerans]TDE09846.1 DUF305 domain-containing protein [Dyadobacter psychrotolerans]